MYLMRAALEQYNLQITRGPITTIRGFFNRLLKLYERQLSTCIARVERERERERERQREREREDIIPSCIQNYHKHSRTSRLNERVESAFNKNKLVFKKNMRLKNARMREQD